MTPAEEPLPARAYMLEWVRYVAPDLRIRHGETLRVDTAEDGTETVIIGSVCRFTLNDKTIEMSADGEGARDQIVASAYRYVRETLGRPLRRAAASREREQQIVAARYAGNEALAEALTRELVTANEGHAPAPRERRYEPIAPPRPHPLAPHQPTSGRAPEPFARRW